MTIFLFVAGLVLLVVGAEALVKGASRMASVFGISPLVIGLTVVAFGTSSPELAVSIKAALSGQSAIAVGNVIGSNIFNVLFILGIAALVMPLIVSEQLVRLDVPLMIVLSIVILLFSLDSKFSRIEGLILVSGLAAYVCFLIRQSRKERVDVQDDYVKVVALKDSGPSGGMIKNIGLILGGLGLLVVGSGWLVDGAVTFAHYMGVSQLVIGLTIVAAGTSLPELVTSVIAVLRGERDIAVGNVVGSNIFNMMGVLGVASVVAPSGIEVSPAVSGFDIPVMVVVAFACLPIFFTGGVISRKEGALLLGYYVAYTLYLILAAAHHDALPKFSVVMLYFAIPLTLLTISIVAIQEFRGKKKKI